MKAQFEFKLPDMWVGAFWKRSESAHGDTRTDVWLCAVPCVPLHVMVFDSDLEEIALLLSPLSFYGRRPLRLFAARLELDQVQHVMRLRAAIIRALGYSPLGLLNHPGRPPIRIEIQPPSTALQPWLLIVRHKRHAATLSWQPSAELTNIQARYAVAKPHQYGDAERFHPISEAAVKDLTDRLNNANNFYLSGEETWKCRPLMEVACLLERLYGDVASIFIYAPESSLDEWRLHIRIGTSDESASVYWSKWRHPNAQLRVQLMHGEMKFSQVHDCADPVAAYMTTAKLLNVSDHYPEEAL